MNWYIDL